MTANVLFAWELGDGLGHVSRLLRIAERLRSAGMACRFVVRNLELAGRAAQSAGFEVLQAPIARVEPIRGPDGTQPVTVGDILGAIGFGSVDRLSPIVAGWHALVELTRPDLVVTDYAPTMNLALFGGPVPWIPIGDGFTLPPCETERFLPFRRARPAYDEEHLRSVVAQIQAGRGRPTPDRLPQLFEGSARFVITLPELDPWRRARKIPAIGPIDPPPRPVESAPTEAYFAYLSAGFPYTERVLGGLLASGRTGSVFLRDSTAAQREGWRKRGLPVWDTPQNMRSMAERAAVIVHHGGVGTVEQTLGLGRPQMLVPRHFEQFANADSLGALGVAVGLRGGGKFAVEDVGRALACVVDDPGYRDRAASRARELADRPLGALDTVTAECIAWTSRKRGAS
ncbi:nucleotide disphospho-sugar-binding domain-containing protein [Thalassobaculum sp.]|uniref:glycosyltransferase n=1 Tax=Thalassobaculum sp. TaxID=2022740 RepID=UPI0032EC7263